MLKNKNTNASYWCCNVARKFENEGSILERVSSCKHIEVSSEGLQWNMAK